MHVDISGLDVAKSEDFLDELKGTDAELRVDLDDSGHPTGRIITDPADLKKALDRLVSKGKISVVDLQEVRAPISASEMIGALRDLSHVSQMAGPKTSADAIEGLYQSELAACRDLVCRQRVQERYPNLALVIQRLRNGSEPCEEASLDYAAILQGINDVGHATVTQANDLRRAGAVVDSACLSAPWDTDSPSVARTGGGPVVQGALNATALIEIAGRDQPFCGGLFVTPVEVLTTLHCFSHAEQYDALKNGRVVVRQMGAGQATPASAVAWSATPTSMPPPTLVGRRDIPVAEDVIRLRLTGGPPAVPRVTAAGGGKLSDAFVPGYFLTRDKNRRPAGVTSTWDASTPEWWKGVRWAKPGSCVVVDRSTDCFRMMCQTTHGYSGSPVFSTETDANGSLRIYGLVKGTEGSVNICRPQPLQFSTLGVSASNE
jgi:hypothetical protein